MTFVQPFSVPLAVTFAPYASVTSLVELESALLYTAKLAAETYIVEGVDAVDFDEEAEEEEDDEDALFESELAVYLFAPTALFFTKPTLLLYVTRYHSLLYKAVQVSAVVPETEVEDAEVEGVSYTFPLSACI